MIVAIDGTVCSGKSTVARLLAHSLNFTYVNSGAIYRAVTLKAYKLGVVDASEEEIVKLANSLEIDMSMDKQGKFKITLDGEDVSCEINLPYISQNVAKIAKIKGVRTVAKSIQKSIATSKDSVVEGRDIGTEVFPNAEVKFFMTADIDVRANRRYLDYCKAGKNIPIEQVREEILLRDKMDMEREISPLKPSADAIIYYNNGSDVNAVIAELKLIVLNKKVKEERVW